MTLAMRAHLFGLNLQLQSTTPTGMLANPIMPTVLRTASTCGLEMESGMICLANIEKHLRALYVKFLFPVRTRAQVAATILRKFNQIVKKHQTNFLVYFIAILFYLGSMNLRINKLANILLILIKRL